MHKSKYATPAANGPGQQRAPSGITNPPSRPAQHAVRAAQNAAFNNGAPFSGQDARSGPQTPRAVVKDAGGLWPWPGSNTTGPAARGPTAPAPMPGGQSVFGESLNQPKPIPTTTFVKKPTVKMVLNSDKPKGSDINKENLQSSDALKEAKEATEQFKAALNVKAVEAKVEQASGAIAAANKNTPGMLSTKPTTKPTIKIESSSDDEDDELAAKFAKLQGITPSRERSQDRPQATEKKSGGPPAPVSHAPLYKNYIDSNGAAATSNDDVIGLTKKDVEQVQGKVAAHLDSLSEGKHKPFTKAEIDESAQRIRTELIARPAAFYKSDQFRKAMVTAIADYLNSLDCNPGQPITAALIQNVLTSNGRNYLNLCARLVSLGVMGASEDEIFNLNNAIQAAEDKLWLTRKDATSTRETSTENGSSPKINMTNLSTKAQPDVDTQPKIDTKPVVPTQPTISTKPVVQTKPTVGAQPSTPVKAALRGETSASAAPSGIWTPKQDIAPANMAAWPSQQKRENRAQHRRAILKGIPSDWKLDQVQAHIWGGRIERIERTADSSTAWVKFMTMEGYNKYFADTANGIEVAGSTRLILAEPDEGPNSTNDLLSSMVESGVTRCVRALDAEEDWSMPTLTRIARGKDRKLDKIKIGKEKGRNFVEFRFSSVYEALVFKKELMDDEDWEPTTIVYAPDPCDVHSGIHLDD